MRDIVKGIVYDRGKKVLGGESKHLSLVALIVASDEPIASENECVVMGSCDMSEQIALLKKYKPPYKLGDLSGAIVEVSSMSPDDFEENQEEER